VQEKFSCRGIRGVPYPFPNPPRLGDNRGLTYLRSSEMTNEVLLYTGSAVSIVWGIAHLAPTKPVVKGFGDISPNNKRIIIMEWLAEGFTIIFIGLLVLLVTALYDYSNAVSTLVYRVCAGMLALMAILTAFTGARTKITPIRICPFVKISAAVLFILGSTL